jgi:hypothetical protein
MAMGVKMSDELAKTWNDETLEQPMCPACERPTDHPSRAYQTYCVVCRRGTMSDPSVPEPRTEAPVPFKFRVNED